jgi:hypothetical protein
MRQSCSWEIENRQDYAFTALIDQKPLFATSTSSTEMRRGYVAFASPFLPPGGNASPAKRPHGRPFKESLRELRGRSVEARAAMDAKIDICVVRG